MLQAKM